MKRGVNFFHRRKCWNLRIEFVFHKAGRGISKFGGCVQSWHWSCNFFWTFQKRNIFFSGRLQQQKFWKYWNKVFFKKMQASSSPQKGNYQIKLRKIFTCNKSIEEWRHPHRTESLGTTHVVSWAMVSTTVHWSAYITRNVLSLSRDFSLFIISP